MKSDGFALQSPHQFSRMGVMARVGSSGHDASTSGRYRPGFTLLELLVILGVLVFLIAMLVPAYSKAHRQARTVACLANLQNFQLAYGAYQHQYPERSFPYDPTHRTFWMDALAPFFPDVPGMRLCPEAGLPSYGWGSARTAWGPYDPAHVRDASLAFLGNRSCSYGFNGWLYSVSAEDFDESPWRQRLLDRIPIFADAVWVEGWPLESDLIPADTNLGAGPGDADLGRFYIARHGESINACFLDGHAEQVPLINLKGLRWASSRQFHTPGLRPR
jgi:prepilin-type processing-associated H-X9-DG protein